MDIRVKLARRERGSLGAGAVAQVLQQLHSYRLRHLPAIFVAILMTLTGCASNALPPSSHTPSPSGGESSFSSDEYLIGPDDIVQVSVWGNPGLSVEVPVRPDGMISMPLLGDVRAGGLTAEQVASSITEQLSRDIRNPNVVVILLELRSHEFVSRIRVTGAVAESISIPHRPGMTVLDAVLAAGGPTEFASPDKAILFRKSGQNSTKLRVRLNKIMKKGDVSTNYDLQPGDIVSIPERVF